MSPPSRGIFIALLVLGVFGLIAVVPGAVGAAVQESDDELEPEWDSGTNFSMVAQLDADGNAQWSLSTTIELETEEDIEAYRSVAADFENGDLPPLGLEAFEAGLEGVNGHTEREMQITDIERSTASEDEIEAGNGRFTVEFTWQNFARQGNENLYIDRNVLVMSNGELWLKGLSESQSLTIIAPPEFAVDDATVGPQNGELNWQGPFGFNERSLQATFVGLNSGNGSANGDGNGTEDPSSSMPWIVIPVAALGVVLLVLFTRFEQFRNQVPSDISVRSLPLLRNKSATANGTQTEQSTERPATTAEPDEKTDDESQERDEELLSDEERVERLLSSNGGRMKQANIVKETDWSNAKVSQLLSSMEEEGRIDKLRIGRENLISFPEEDITNTDK